MPAMVTQTGSDQTPRRPLLWSAMVCIVGTFLLAWPALTGAFLVSTHSDQYLAGFAFREYAANSLRAGHGFPLWNPYQFSGMPYVAAMHGDIFYPTFLLRMIFPTDVAMTWGFIVHMVLAGVFMIGFLRAVGVRFQPALIGGLAYLLSGPIASYASPGHDGKLFVSALLPAALWALVKGIRTGSMAAWGVLSIVTGLAVLSPHPQLLQYMLLVCGVFALWLTFHDDPLAVDQDGVRRTRQGSRTAMSDRIQRERVKRLGLATLALLVGGAMGAIQYLPVREYTPWSPRAGGKDWAHAVSFSFPLEETINMYLPQFSGILDKYWGRNPVHLHSEYLGAAVLILMLSGLGGGLANRHRKHGWFWLATFVIALLWSWGGNTPFYQIVYALVPGTKYFRAPSMMLYVVAFAAAVLAAFGAERVLAGRVRVRTLAVCLAIAIGITLMASAGGLTSIALGIAGDSAGDRIMDNAGNVVIGAWRSLAVVVATCVVAWMVRRDRVPATRAGWLLLAIVGMDLWSISRHYWLFSPRAEQLYAGDPIIDFLRNPPQPSRVLALRLNENTIPNDPFLLGDALMHHRVRGVLGYHGNELGRYRQLYGFDEGLRSIANPNFWALTNARYLYTDVAEVPFQGARLVAGPVRNAAGTMTYLYQLPGDNPQAWVTPGIVKLDDATAKSTILDPRFDVRRAAIFDSAAPVAARELNARLPDALSITASVTRFEPGAIDVMLDAPAPEGSALIVSENYYPGWSATVDARSARIGRADYTLMGVELPTGARNIALRFDNAPYHTGKLITLLALGLAAAFTAFGIVKDRRRLQAAA